MNGKGIFIWKIKNVYKGDVQVIANRAVAIGLEWICIKILDGAVGYNYKPTIFGWKDIIIPPLVEALHNVGISVYGYQYVYLKNGLREAERAILRTQKHNLDGFLIDAESEVKNKHTQARLYTEKLAELAVPIGLCSYRFPTVHPELPWNMLLSVSDFHCPQVYWIHGRNPARQLQRSVEELKFLKDIPVVPVGAAFDEHGWTPLIKELDEFNMKAREMNLPGITWWEWAEAIPLGFENVIANHQWDIVEPPQPPLTLPERMDRIEFVAKNHGWVL